jgi:hypothetical protein
MLRPARVAAAWIARGGGGPYEKLRMPIAGGQGAQAAHMDREFSFQ